MIEGYGKRLRMALPGMQGMAASQITPVAVPSADLEEIRTFSAAAADYNAEAKENKTSKKLLFPDRKNYRRQ